MKDSITAEQMHESLKKCVLEPAFSTIVKVKEKDIKVSFYVVKNKYTGELVNLKETNEEL